jgi:hypothetical protein
MASSAQAVSWSSIPALVHHEQIARPQTYGLLGTGVGDPEDRVGLTDDQPGPGAVVGPAPAVLEGQPGR